MAADTGPEPPSPPGAPTPDRRSLLAGIGGIAAAAVLTRSANAGPLNPPAGPVASSGKTLTEVEPRIAINSTNTRGDANSVYKITQPGSYYLTGNIAGISGRRAIEIAAGDVTIDLMGFSLIGVPGSLEGIAADGARDNITIRNGVVRDFGGIGVAVSSIGVFGTGGLLADLLIANNGSHGCFPNNSSVVRHCVARNNAGTGFLASLGLVVESCAASGNGGAGFSLDSGGVVSQCLSRENHSGFFAASACVFSRSVAELNTNNGFTLFAGCTIMHCATGQNRGHGIDAANANIITDNTCDTNGFSTGTGAGIHIHVGNDNRIEGNNCTFADRGIHIETSGNLVIRNSCSGNTTNYDIAAGNRYGPIIDLTAGATLGVSGNAATSTVNSTDPWANFAY